MAFEISGKVFVDANRNDQFDGLDMGSAGVRVYVDLNGNNVFDAYDVSTVTDDSGDWSLNLYGRALGKDVRFEDSGGPLNAGPDEYHLADPEIDRDDINFYYKQPTPQPEPMPDSFSLTGSVYEDFDDDGQRDFGEEPVEGARVYLDSNNNGKFDPGEVSALTNSLGEWFANDFPDSDFGDPLRVEAPDGFEFNGPGKTDYEQGEQGIRQFVTPEGSGHGCELDLVKFRDIGRNPYAEKHKLVYKLELTEDMIEGGSVRDFSLDLDLEDPYASFIFAKAKGGGVQSVFDRRTGEIEGWVKYHKPDLEAGDTLRIVVKVKGDVDPDDISCTFTDLDDDWYW